MRKTLLLFVAIAFSLALGAQSTARDFEKPDCEGVNHHLFDEIDSGYVCMIEFIMINCQPCVVAGNGLKAIHAQFQTSHPGKVRFYGMGCENYVSCVQMKNWATTYNFKNTMFSGESKQVSYYGGMGMPTTVILGGLSKHKVYYVHQGYSSSENSAIINAINLAISESSVSASNELPDQAYFHAFPNPFDKTLTVRVNDVEVTHIALTNLTGKELLRQDVHPESGGSEVHFATEGLPGGLYLVALYQGKRLIGVQKLVHE